jgi:hypothetical protein
MQSKKMNKNNLIVFFLAIASLLSLVANVSAGELTNADQMTVKVNGIIAGDNDISVIAGKDITVEVFFNSLVSASHVRMKAEIEGDKVDIEDKTDFFDIEESKRYSRRFSLKVPYDFSEKVSEDMTLSFKVWNGDHRTEKSDITLRVQKPTYNIDIKSVAISQSVEAGESLPVGIVLRNVGYNDLEDLYVTVTIPELDIKKTSYFGDLVAIEEDDDEDTVSGKLYLKIPYDAVGGIYTLDVKISNGDLVTNTVKDLVVKNDFSNGNVIQTSEGLFIVNPTSKLKVYRLIFPTTERYVTVLAGSSRTVKINEIAETTAVSVLSMDGKVIESFTFNPKEEDSTVSTPVVLAVIVFIILLVSLIVLIVLIGKKPEKAEDIGESYY